MPLLLIALGIALIVSGFKGTTGQLATLVSNDMTGAGAPGGHGFLTWIAAIGIIGGFGYITPIQRPARLMVALIIVVMVLKSDTGIFANFFKAFGGAEQAGTMPGESLASRAAVVVGQNASGSGGDQVYQQAGQGSLAVSNDATAIQAGIDQALYNGTGTTGSGTSGGTSGGTAGGTSKSGGSGGAAATALGAASSFVSIGSKLLAFL